MPRSPLTFTLSAAAQYLENLDTELKNTVFDSTEQAKLQAVMTRKLVDRATRQSYLHRFSQLLTASVEALFATQPKPRVVELGCGSGTASLLFALLGADVLALDVDPDLIRACRKRQALYENCVGPLSLRFECGDVLSRSFELDGRFDGIYSLFAFNIMQPTRELLSRLAPALAPGGRLVISDGNRESIYNRLFRRRQVLRPRELERELTQRGFITQSISYETVIPSVFWRWRGLLKPALRLERALTRSSLARWVSTSYTLVSGRV